MVDLARFNEKLSPKMVFKLRQLSRHVIDYVVSFS